jgi:hypothetical protein
MKMAKKKPEEIEQGTIIEDKSSPTGKMIYMFGSWHSYPLKKKKKKVKTKKDAIKEAQEAEDKRQQEVEAKRQLQMLAHQAAIASAVYNHPSLNVIESGDGWALVHLRCSADIYKNIEMGAGFQPFEKTSKTDIDVVRFLAWSSKSTLGALANKIKISFLLEVRDVNRFAVQGLDYE